jgi:hypothetical protein
LRILIDWTLALLVRPEVVNVDLDSETALMLRELALRDGATMHIEAMSHSPRRGSRDPALGPDTEAENSAAYLVDR